ncbi:MAG: hypothetical protein CMJ79_01270 [Planctomycetaceae bacterium]|nr:hypothetical protein [Planctomycetaceae bacterium]
MLANLPLTLFVLALLFMNGYRTTHRFVVIWLNTMFVVLISAICSVPVLGSNRNRIDVRSGYYAWLACFLVLIM